MKIARMIALCAVVCTSVVSARPSDPVTLNFVNADIETVIRAIGELTGKNFIIDPRVKGTVNIISAAPVPRELAYQILLSSLRLQGFSAVEAQGVVKILPEADAKLHAGFGHSRRIDSDRLITQVFALKNSNVTQLLPVIRPIVSPNNALSAFPQANALVVTDYADNIRRIEAIIASVEGAASGNTAVIPLLYASSLELAATLSKLLQDGASDSGKTWIGADARANVLLVRSETQGRLDQVKRLVMALDQPSQAGANVRVVYLKNADAARVAQTLRALLSSSAAPLALTARTTLPSPTASGGTTASSDAGSNAVNASATALPSTESTEGASTSGGGAANLVQADTASNALILNLPDSMYRNLRNVIDQLDRRRAQVYVETLVMEVSASRMLELGVQWQALSGAGQNGARLVGNSNFGNGQDNGGGVLNLGAANGGFSTFSQGGLNIGVSRGVLNIPGLANPVLNLGMLARALETEAQGNILSNPNLMATDNEKARIEVGQEISITTGSYASTSGATTAQPFNTFDRKKIGFKLEIVPQISEGGTIRMKLLQEASSLDPSSRNQNNPTTNIRSVETSVTVDDGGIIAIGGLIQEKVSDDEDKVPLLGDIPGLGWLFRHQVKRRDKTNLLVFLKPTIVRDDSGAHAIAQERYRYIIGDTLERSQRKLPLDINNAIETLPSSIKQQLAPGLLEPAR